MRIVGGSAKGHEIAQPKSSKTRPLSDKAREGLFNVLGDIDGLKMLDAYAGSGAVGLEALSRGVAHVTGVEIAKPAAQIIRRNFYNLQFAESYRLCVQSVQQWINQNKSELGSYDLIFAGPPYIQLDLRIVGELLNYLKPGGLLVVEHSRREGDAYLTGASLVTSRRYGESVLAFYKKRQ